MKLKYIVIVSLILAILTLGAVSASDDGDNLTAVDDAAAISTDDNAQAVSQVEESDSVAGNGSGDEVLSVGEQDANYDELIPDGIRIGGNWEEEYERMTYVGIRFYDEDISGNVEFYVDGDLKSTRTAECCYYGDERGVYFDLLENDIGIGMHNISMKYLGDEKYAPFEINDNVEVYYMKAYVPETVVIGDNQKSFSLTFAVDATGFVDLYLDGEKVTTYDVYDARYDEEFNYVRPSFRVNVDEFTNFGEHTYALRYYGGNYEDRNMSGSFNLDYLFEVEQYGELKYGEPIEFYVYLPMTVDGNITLTVNGKKYQMKAEGDYNIFKFTDRVYGETDFIFSYEDSNYPQKNITISRNIMGGIKFDDGDYVPYNSQDNNVTLMLPSDAKGNLVVYKRSDNTDENGNYILILVQNVTLQDGIASVPVSDWGIGSFSVVAKYTGDDYPVEDGIWDFEICPDVEYPKAIWLGSTDEYQVIIKSPEDIEGNITVKITGETARFESVYDDEGYYLYDRIVYDFEQLLYDGEAKGTVNISLLSDEFNYHDLEKGKYYLRVQYENINAPYGFKVGDRNPDWTMEVIVPKEVAKGDEKYEEYGFWPQNAPLDDGDAWIYLYIDGKRVNSRMIEDDGEFDYPISYLDIGTHTWKVTYGSSSYYSNASAEGTFEVVWISIPEEVIDGVTTVECHMDYDATGYISLSIDGKEYAMEFVENGYASFLLSNLTFGEHTYEFTYSGDAYHEQLTKTGSFNNTMKFEMNDWLDYDDTSAFAKSYPVSFILPEDATGTITLTVGNKTYTKEVVDGTASFEITDLGIGQYNLVAAYSGDEKYPAREISKEFEIIGYAIDVVYPDEYELEYFISVSIDLPGDATGRLVIYKEEYDDEGDSQWVELKAVELENGKATILASELGLSIGNYRFKAAYEGNYEVEYTSLYAYLRPIIDMPESLNLGENATIEIDLYNTTGSIVISINGEEFKTVALENGKISVVVPADKLPNKTNIVTFRYVGDDLTNNPFGYYDYDYDNDCEVFVPYEYEIAIKLIKMDVSDGFAADGSGNITLELPEGANGSATVYVDDEFVSTTPVTGGTNTIPVSGLSTGDHSLRVEFEDENGDKYSTESAVNVPKYEAEMEITTPTDSTGPEFTVNLPEDATGSLIVSVNGKNYPVDLVGGKATVSDSDLEDRTYDVTVKYTGDDKYEGFTKETTVTINTKHEEFNLTCNGCDFASNDAVVSIYVPSGSENETIVITVKKGSETISTKSYKIAKEDLGKQIHYTLSDLGIDSVGTYDVSLSLNNTELAHDSFEVNKVNSSIVLTGGFEFNYGDSGNVTFTITGATVAQENVTVVGHPEAVISVEGNSIKISGLGADTYTLKVITTPDENHNSVEGTATITVNKVMATIEVGPIEMDYLKTGTAQVTVNGATIDSVFIDGHPEANAVFENGIISVSGLDAGTYTLKIVSTPDGNHSAVNASTTVKVLPLNSEITVSDVEFEAGETVTVPFTVVGATVAKENVTVDGHPEAVISVEGNTITISNLDVGTYTLIVTTTPDKNYKSATNTSTIIIKSKDVPPVVELIDPNLTISVASIVEGSDALVIITTNDTFSGDVKVRIADSNYTVRVVNGKGNISVSGLKANDYTAFAIFGQTSVFKASEANATFTVKAKADSGSKTPAKKATKITLKLQKVKKVKRSAKKLVIKATLKINGKAVKGKKLKFKFNKKTYTAKTNRKGVAKITIKKKVLKKLKVGKKVKIQVSYGKKTVKQKVKVKR